MQKEQLMKQMAQIYDKYMGEFKELNEYIYNNPELGHKEVKACVAHSNMLKKHGFDVETGFAGVPTSFKGTYVSGNGGPKVAILAEYDALPEVGHGCGHNIFGVTSVAAGIMVKELLGDIAGEISVIGTPAEETDGAKVAMAAKGVFDDFDIAMAVHPTGEAHTRSGTSLAIEPLRFTFKGKTAHAAASPHEGINALDGVINLFNTINAMRQQILPSQRIHGIIVKGGEAANVIPDLAVADFYVRSETGEQNAILVERVKNCAKGAALACGATVEITNYSTSFTNLVTNEKLSQTYENNLLAQGITKIKSKDSGGSTDMGDVSQKCPAIHPYFPLTSEHLIGHSIEFAKATLTPEAYKGSKEAAIAMALTAMEIYTDKELLATIKAEFEKNVLKK